MRRIIRMFAALLTCFMLFTACTPAETPADGNYTAEAALSGGSGRASVASPTTVTVKDGHMKATIVWSSPYYEWMKVNGVQYDPVQTDGNSTFVIPVALDTDISITALTLAMSEPHEVEYTLRFDGNTLSKADALASPVGSMELSYATQFSVDYYANGCKLITLADGSRFLVVPEEGTVPNGLDTNVVVLKRPIQNIYLAATSAMCLFDALDSLGSVSLSGTKADGWYNENAREAMETGAIRYAGKYNEPDYEMILSSHCGLAVESTMIGHAPEVKEKLEALSIPVFVDQSSQEKHPLGRTEWIRLYGVLLGREDEAERFFAEQLDCLDQATAKESTGKTAAFFYISTSGYAVARKSGDYVSKMIELAGGKYIFDDLGDPETSTSTVTLEMEQFYATAKDADYIIYNSTIGGELHSMDELLSKNELLSDFKAVQNGNVWCTGKNLFQETTQLGRMILDINRMLTNNDPSLDRFEFLYKLH